MEKKKILKSIGILSLVATWITLLYFTTREGQLGHSLFMIYSYLLIILFVYRVFFKRLKDAINKHDKPTDDPTSDKEESP